MDKCPSLGEYEQGRGTLRDGNTFCCLGVLCDLYGKVAGEEWQETLCDEDGCEDWENGGGNGFIATQCGRLGWIGKRGPDNQWPPWNDAQSRDFAAIADMIQSGL